MDLVVSSLLAHSSSWRRLLLFQAAVHGTASDSRSSPSGPRRPCRPGWRWRPLPREPGPRRRGAARRDLCGVLLARVVLLGKVRALHALLLPSCYCHCCRCRPWRLRPNCRPLGRAGGGVTRGNLGNVLLTLLVLLGQVRDLQALLLLQLLPPLLSHTAARRRLRTIASDL